MIEEGGSLSRRVLIVEDDDATRDLMSRLMRGAGCDVRAAGTVAEGLAHLRAELPTHVLLDLMLPDADGVVLLRAVRRKQLRVRVALVTAAGRGSEAVATAVLEHPDAVFHKPVDVGELQAWVGAAPPGAPTAAARRTGKRLLVDIDLGLLAAHLAQETGDAFTDQDVRQWLQDTGFTPHQDMWLVREAELGQLDPAEVRAVDDAPEPEI